MIQIAPSELIEFDLNTNTSNTISTGSDYSALVYDAVGNLYYIPSGASLVLNKIDATTRSTSLVNIIATTSGTQKFDGYPAITYDATRNVLAYNKPGVTDLQQSGTIQIAPSELIEFDLNTNTSNTRSTGGENPALVYDAVGNLYYVTVFFSYTSAVSSTVLNKIDATTRTTSQVNVIATTSGTQTFGGVFPAIAYYSGQPVSPKNNGGKTNPDCAICALLAGDPVNIATGNKFLNEVDYISGGSSPLILRRSYNSYDKGSSSQGMGWRGAYGRSLTISNFQVNVMRDDGKVLTFVLNGSIWQSSSDINSRLVQLTNGWQYTTGLDEIEIYNTNGQLISVTDRKGLTQNLSYDAQGNLVSVTNPFGMSLTFSYTGSWLSSVTVPNGGQYTYTYDAYNNLSTVTYPDQTQRTYLYENSTFPHALTGVIDENGNRYSTDVYDNKGRDIKNQLAGGVNSYSLNFLDQSQVAVTDALGATRTSTFRYINQVPTETQMIQSCPGCSSNYATATTSKVYDANGNIASETDFNGNITRYTYDINRNLLLSRTEAAGTAQERTINTTWHAMFRLPVSIVEPGRTTTFSYDSKGNLLNKTITAGMQVKTWTFTYNANSQPLTIDGPRTDVNDMTTFTYDTQGNLSTKTNALGQVTQITSYNADGKPLTIQDPNGLVTTLQYDPRGLLISSTAGTEQATYSYDHAQLLNKITLPNGATYTYSYDAAHRLTKITDVFGNHIDYTLDDMGNRLSTQLSDAANHVVQSHTNSFDPLSHLAQSIGSQGQTTAFQYDANGNITGITDPLNNPQSKTYDALNRLTSLTDPNGGKTTYSYDANNNIQQITDPLGLNTLYTYDGLSDLVTLSSPDTGVSQKAYDAAGNVLTSTDARGKVTTYSYDALNRLITIHRNDGGVISYTYDSEPNSIGHLVKMVDDTDTTHWTYDSHGRVTTKSQSYAGENLSTISYAYDNAGNLAQMTYPTGYKMSYNYDRGRLTQVNVDNNPVVTNISYSPMGGITSMQYANGTTYTRQFDTDGRISQYTALGTRNISLTYDAASRITQYTDSDNVVNQSMEYDALGRINSANGFFGTEAYTYDANGNRLSSVVNGALQNYTYDTASNHLLSISSIQGATNYTLQRTYDAVGNTLTTGVQSFTFNDMGRLEIGRRRPIFIQRPGTTHIQNQYQHLYVLR